MPARKPKPEATPAPEPQAAAPAAPAIVPVVPVQPGLPQETLLALVNRYVETLQLTRTIRASTLYLYQTRILVFLRDLPPNAPPDAITPLALKTHVLQQAKSSRESARLSRHALRHWCKWLTAEEVFAVDPSANIPDVKDTPHIREAADDTIIEKMLAACDLIPNNLYYAALTKAALYVLAYSGLRKAELLQLNIGDIDLTTGRLDVRDGKGGKARMLYLPQSALDAVSAFLLYRKQPHTTPEMPLLTLYPQDAAPPYCHKQNLYTMIRTALRHAGLEETHVTPHQFRHSRATRLVKNGADIATVRDYLGHSSITTTGRYLHTSDNGLRLAASQVLLPNATPPDKPEEPEPPAPQPKPKPTPPKSPAPVAKAVPPKKPAALPPTKGKPAPQSGAARSAAWRREPPKLQARAEKPVRLRRQNLR